MRNNSSISLHHPNGLPKHQNKDSNDIGVDGNEGDFYWYQILILPIRTFSLENSPLSRDERINPFENSIQPCFYDVHEPKGENARERVGKIIDYVKHAKL